MADALGLSLFHDFFPPIGRDHDNGGNVGQLATAAQQPHHLNAVIAGHLPVHQHQIIGVAAFGGAHQLFQRGIAAGHLPDDTDPLSLSIVFDGFLMGLSTLSRDGMPLATLEAAITQLMTLWDACAAAGKGSI